MKKLKILLVTSLSLLLCFMCIMTTTFSWFTRPKSITGNALEFTNQSYNTSINDGSISMVTYASSDGKNYGTSAVSAFSNSTGLASGGRKYYRTDIINSGNYDQTVSLYLSNLTLSSDTGNFFLGVNSPTKTYKQYGGATTATGKVASTINKQNVYLGLHSEEISDLTNNADYLHVWDNNNNSVDIYLSQMENTGRTDNYHADNGFNSTETFNMYSATIDTKYTGMKFKCKNSWLGSDTIIANNNTIAYYKWGGKYYADTEKSGQAAKLVSYYSSASVGKGSSISIQATASGESIQYSSSNTSVATVDSNGNVTGVGAGSATITVKVYGVYGDCLESTCSVLVTSSDKSLTDVPIVTNVLVPKGAGTETGSTVESVYWYIKNDATSGTLKYTISDVYLTL